MGSLRIALVAPPWYPVPPIGYGGIELVVALLADGLRRRGHEVHVFGAADSPGDVIGVAEPAWREDLGRYQTQALREVAYALEVQRILDEPAWVESLDIVHEHSGIIGLLTAPARDPRVVHTVHGPITEPWETAYRAVSDKVGLVAISHHQRSTAPNLNWVATIHNAVDTGRLIAVPRSEKQPYLLVLARICVEKGQRIAIEVARRTGLRLVLAGKIEHTPAGLEYYHRHVQPAIDGERIVHLPNVAGREKAELLARATALLAPLTWPEPFGIAMAEAIASGTPCIAFREGAAPELVDDGGTGFLVNTADEMVEAVGRIGDIDPARCSLMGRHRFAPDTMVSRYQELYTSFLEGRAPGTGLEQAEATASA